MTGFEGNRHICPKRFRIASTRVSLDQGAVEVNRNFWGVLNLKGQIDSLVP